jgi:septal ring factor EnvC (AmiA/AmiB activator)
MHIFRRDKKEDKDVEAIDFFEQVQKWKSSQSQPAQPVANQPAPLQPLQPSTSTQPSSAQPQGFAPSQVQMQTPQVSRSIRSPIEELLELAKNLNIDLKPLEELKRFAQDLDSKIAELEKEAAQLEKEAKEKRRAVELLRRLREQLGTMGV